MNVEQKDIVQSSVVITLTVGEAIAIKEEISKASTSISYSDIPALDKLEDHLIDLDLYS